jgi:hypothetical protein
VMLLTTPFPFWCWLLGLRFFLCRGGKLNVLR